MMRFNFRTGEVTQDHKHNPFFDNYDDYEEENQDGPDEDIPVLTPKDVEVLEKVINDPLF